MIQSIRGTKDILPDSSYQWHFIESKFREISAQYGYEELRSPIFEKTEVFSRGIGEGTDIVNKEMYTFTDRGGESITLRPEGTAGLVRAVVQNNILQQGGISRLWYLGPYFRYERPQKGRLRQFHQYGAECIASSNPESDVEIICLANSIFKSIGINEYKLNLNTLGTRETRLAYRTELIKFLSSFKDRLSDDSKYRLEINPLRVLDSKEERDKEVTVNAPSILDFLDSVSSDHFNYVKSLLDELSISYEIQPKLVRGLDYYNHTVFEFQSSSLGSQDSFGGGGRYDNLFEELGGKATQAVGFALGCERILLILEKNNSLPQKEKSADVFIVNSGDGTFNQAIILSEYLRKSGIKVSLDLQRRSMKSQFKEANKISANFCIIIGEDEIKSGVFKVKDMLSGEQFEISKEDNVKLIDILKKS